MKNLLQINTSLFSGEGQSSRLAEEFVAGFVRQHPGTTVVTRDLSRQPIPHLSAERFQAFLTPADKRTPEQAVTIAESDELIDELRQADVIVLGLPMYNFSVPSTLKAYFDHVARADVTFRYSDKGPVGLLTDKKAYVFATRGGQYAGTSSDSQTALVRTFLGFLGIMDVEFVYAEGLAINTELKDKALANARRSIEGFIGEAVV